ncbi:MAG TPA: serine/threonine-protein kinase [Kofleriaceae bacterium]|nr:serine/threonine-protein kinase [Kofleriaceae bacterium]
MEGRLIGQYRVTGVLGKGGMGVVYAARHTLLGRPAAVKVLLPKLSDDQAIVTRFFNEARAATAIQHPGIVEVYDFGWTNEGAAFIVMEHLQGETLRARRKRGPMPWNHALAVTRQIAGALSAAHAAGIVHRDLKPDNIFLVPDPEVPGGERIKLLDFGIAKLTGTSTGLSMTRTGAVIGTPTYMAPEQCRGVAVDSRADLYSLGCILFELLAGRPPFVGEGEGEVLAAHIHVPPPALGSLARGLPSGSEALVQRLLAKAPRDRVQTADEVIRRIDAAGATLGDPRAIISASNPSLRPPASPAPCATLAVGNTVHADTTLSSGISSSHRVPPPPARHRHLIRLGVAGSAIALAAVIASSFGGGDGEPALATASSPAGSADATTVDAREALPPPPPTPPPSQSASTSAHLASTPSSPSTAPAAAPAPAPAPSPASPPVEKVPTKAKRAPPVVGKDSPPRPETAKQRPVALETLEPSEVEVEVEIDSSPPGAEVILNGQVIGKTPYHGKLARTNLAVKLLLRLPKHAQQQFTVYPSRPIKEVVTLKAVADNQSINPFK